MENYEEKNTKLSTVFESANKIAESIYIELLKDIILNNENISYIRSGMGTIGFYKEEKEYSFAYYESEIENYTGMKELVEFLGEWDDILHLQGIAFDINKKGEVSYL